MSERYGVMSLVLEWSISIIVLLGGGFLLFEGRAEVLAASAIGAVITFWFQRRQNEQFLSQIQQQQQLQQPTPITFTQPAQTIQNAQPTQPEQNAVQTQTNTRPFGG